MSWNINLRGFFNNAILNKPKVISFRKELVLYACESCGNITGSEDKDGLCGVCHADNFLPMEAWNLGSQFFRDMVARSLVRHHEYHFDAAGAKIIYPAPGQAKWCVVNKRVYEATENWLAFASGSVNDRL